MGGGNGLMQKNFINTTKYKTLVVSKVSQLANINTLGAGVVSLSIPVHHPIFKHIFTNGTLKAILMVSHFSEINVCTSDVLVTFVTPLAIPLKIAVITEWFIILHCKLLANKLSIAP